MNVTLSELIRVARKAILQNGYDKEETEIILDILLYAQTRGNNQGIVMLIGAGIPKDSNAGEIEIVKETKSSALVDGKQNAGMVVLKTATNLAAQKATEHGFGIAGTFSTHTSSGAIGNYAREIAKKDLVGFVFAGSVAAVCTYGSFRPIFGTNPLAVGVPTENEPVVLDIATAAVAYYGLVEAKAAGRSIPENVGYDCDGKMSTDPGRIIDGGAILPFDRHYKGAGLSLIVEILTGPLVTSAFNRVNDVDQNWGNLVFARNQASTGPGPIIIQCPGQ